MFVLDQSFVEEWWKLSLNDLVLLYTSRLLSISRCDSHIFNMFSDNLIANS